TLYRFDKPDGSPEWRMQWEVRVGVPGLDLGPSHGTEFIGQQGRLMVWRDEYHIFTPDGKELPKPPTENPVNDHWQNWLDCIKSRGKPRSSIESMYQTTTVCHLANVAYLTGERILWDSSANTIKAPKAAHPCQSLRSEYRK